MLRHPNNKLLLNKATAYLAHYWLVNGIYKEGTSTSVNLQSISLSESNPRSPDFIPNIVFNILSQTPYYSRSSFLSKQELDTSDDVFRVNSENGFDIYDGKKKAISWAQAYTLIRDNKDEWVTDFLKNDSGIKQKVLDLIAKPLIDAEITRVIAADPNKYKGDQGPQGPKGEAPTGPLKLGFWTGKIENVGDKAYFTNIFQLEDADFLVFNCHTALKHNTQTIFKPRTGWDSVLVFRRNTLHVKDDWIQIAINETKNVIEIKHQSGNSFIVDWIAGWKLEGVVGPQGPKGDKGDAGASGVDNSQLTNFMSSLVFMDGNNRQFFLDASKEFFFQRTTGQKSAELDFFYLNRETMSKTAVFQIKPNEKKLQIDVQTNFNLAPTFRGQAIGGALTAAQTDVLANLKYVKYTGSSGNIYDKMEFFSNSDYEIFINKPFNSFSMINWMSKGRFAELRLIDNGNLQIRGERVIVGGKNILSDFNKWTATDEKQYVQKHQLDGEIKKVEDELEHIEDSSGFHTLYNQHFDHNELDGTVKFQGDLRADFIEQNNSVNIESDDDWMNENTKYIIEIDYEYELGEPTKNLNTLNLWLQNIAVPSWKFLWRYGGGWNPSVGTIANSLGNGWIEFDFIRNLKFIVEINVWNNQDGSRNYSIIVKGFNQKELQVADFRCWAKRFNVPPKDHIKNVSMLSNVGRVLNRFSKPQHLNIKVKKEVHH